jgi:ribosome assembly protein 4
VLRKNGVNNPFESTLTLLAEPQAVFRVQAVTRMAHKISGHGEAILSSQFSPKTSSRLATGSGDCTARIWDTNTGTPQYTLSGHTGWVLAVSWAPDGSKLATGSMDKTVRIWDDSGKPVNRPLTGHAKWITSIAWEPFHSWRDATPRLASASKDATVRIWIVNSGRTEHVLSGHKGNVTIVRWGGTGLIYTASHDKTVKVWNAVDGTLKHTLSAHAHWVNHLALSTDFVLRTSYFDHTTNVPGTNEEQVAKAKERFDKAAKKQGKIVERLISASDDFTMYLWDPDQSVKPIARLMGHQKQVNHVSFSPDGALIASAGFDNSAKIWSARQVCSDADPRTLDDQGHRLTTVVGTGNSLARCGAMLVRYISVLSQPTLDSLSPARRIRRSRFGTCGRANCLLTFPGTKMRCIRWTGAQMARKLAAEAKTKLSGCGATDYLPDGSKLQLGDHAC